MQVSNTPFIIRKSWIVALKRVKLEKHQAIQGTRKRWHSLFRTLNEGWHKAYPTQPVNPSHRAIHLCTLTNAKGRKPDVESQYSVCGELRTITFNPDLTPVEAIVKEQLKRARQDVNNALTREKRLRETVSSPKASSVKEKQISESLSAQLDA